MPRVSLAGYVSFTDARKALSLRMRLSTTTRIRIGGLTLHSRPQIKGLVKQTWTLSPSMTWDTRNILLR